MPLIREARPEDFERWLPLWEGYNRFYERSIPEAVTRGTWARFFQPAEAMHALVAEQEGELAGFVHFLYHRSTSSLAPVCYLQDLYALPALRGKGIGRALIEAVYEKARAAGSPRVYWLTQENNMVARQLYDRVAERSGFIQYRRNFLD